jgi:hypothetical protein
MQQHKAEEPIRNDGVHRRSSPKGKRLKSPKHCKKCGSRAICQETKKYENHVRRRYLCQCGVAWATYECRKELVEFE